MFSDSHIDIALCGRSIYARISGLANMNNCMTFQDFSTVLLDAGYERAIVDLGHCTGMDSTFLGVLAGMATHFEDRKSPLVVIINANPDNLETLEDVGLTNFLQVHREPVIIPEIETYRIDDDAVPDMDRVEFIKESHERLLRLDERNQKNFGPLIQAMAGSWRGRSKVISNGFSGHWLLVTGRLLKKSLGSSRGAPRSGATWRSRCLEGSYDETASSLRSSQ